MMEPIARLGSAAEEKKPLILAPPDTASSGGVAPDSYFRM
jgi:hypothetical protein